MIRNERAIRTIGTMSLCAALLAATGAEALTVTKVSQVTRPSSSTYGAEQVSGITYAGGNLFYAVDDTDKKLYPITLNIGSNGSLASSGITIGTGVLMSGAADAEGCAFDPCSGNLWVSDETGATIREYDVTSGALLRTAPVPAIQKQYNGNYSLEALTIAGDGKSMWTANEEALKVDGLLATNSVGSVVRLTKFVRDSVHDNWTADGQWAYETQPIGSVKDSHTRSGVSGLCALPDGNLLVLERRCYNPEGFFPDFEIRVYQVNFSGATDIRNISSLKTATYTKTTKTSLWSYSHGSDMPNYEGICLGPCLNDNDCVIVLISDAGSYAEEGIITLKVSGLNMREMYFAENANAEPYGGPYRYVNGTSVTATLPGAGNRYYETNLVTHATWTLSGGRNGSGSTATFDVTADETFTWGGITNDTLPLLAADSFEGSNFLNKTASDLPGWSGGEDGFVAAKSYSPALPPGYPLDSETHTQVLEVDGEVTRTYNTNIVGGVVLDTMVRATLPTPDSSVADVEDAIIAFHFDEDGHPMLQHRHKATTGENAGARLRTQLSDNVYTNGQWLRVTIAITNVSNATWCQVRIDGSTCKTPAGVISPSRTDLAGSWHRAISHRTAVSALALKGTGAVDDVTLYTPTGAPEFNGTGYVDGVSKEDLWDNALPFDASALDEDFDGDGFSNRRELAKDTDPWDKSSHPPYPTVLLW